MHYLLVNIFCALTLSTTSPNAERAQQTLDALYKYYAAPNTCLLRENYPSDQNNKATYLASEEQAKRHNEYSYLWPYSGTFSAVNALLESTGNKKYKKLLENKVLPGLEEYFDTRREPFAYSSYISNQPLSDRFYDDNVWLGIDFTDSYRMTKKQAYLEKAELIWEFILSGKDEVLGGGIYWCEQKKESKNTCSNAPGAVFALKLFQATIGWIILLVSMAVSALLPDVMPMGSTVHLIILGVSAAMIFLYNSPGKNIFLNIGLGLWDSYNMVTGLLGDVLSYVRLFALGLSGGILAGVFNSLAVGMSPDNVIAGPIVMVLIFVIGHAINIFMNVLGAMVHPMRLTFVEFFKNSGYEGGGKEYKPFRN